MINIQLKIKESAESALSEFLERSKEFDNFGELKRTFLTDYRYEGYFASLPSGLSFEDNFELAETCYSEGISELGKIEDFHDIRNSISGMALIYLCIKAENLADEFLYKLDNFISRYELDMNQLTLDDNYSWHSHDSEEDIIDGTIFKHKNVEGEFDIDLYKFHSDLLNIKIYFPKTPEKEEELMEGDYVIRDLVRIESNDLSYEVFIHYGKHIGNFNDWEVAIESVKKDMTKMGYYPDCWHETGRGITEIMILEMDRE